nr:hypothetical protein CFP56_20984 [Quercus suber]
MYTPTARYPVPTANSSRTVVYSGKSEKPFEFDSATLTAKSLYWKKLLASTTARDPLQYRRACTFREPEEISMALFGKWLYGEKLNGPTDFHSTQHYLGLYVLARVWECESLENEEHITSSPYRLEYIYTYTPGPNPMRRFLISTAAFRALTEIDPEGTSSTSEPTYLSAVMQNVLAANTTLTQDYLNAMIHLHRNDMPDARHGSACAWHEHTSTKKCQERPREVWEEQ